MSCPHGNPIGGCDTCDEVDAAFEAGKRSARAEQPAQQEPVAWMNPHGGMLTANYIENFASGLDKEIHNIPLYTTPQAQPAPVQYQRQEIGEGDWEDCTKEQYEKAMALPEWDTRVITAPQAQPSAVATLAPEPDQQAAAVMPCGAVVSNVYEAYEAGKKAQPAREPVKLSGYELDGRRYKTMEERLKDAFYEGFTSSATYNDIELNDVDEEWLKYATAHGITKGNT